MVAALFAPYHQFMAAVTELLVRGRGLRGRARDRTRAAIGHAVSFRTWQQLTAEQGLDDSTAAELMRRLVAAAS